MSRFRGETEPVVFATSWAISGAWAFLLFAERFGSDVFMTAPSRWIAALFLALISSLAQTGLATWLFRKQREIESPSGFEPATEAEKELRHLKWLLCCFVVVLCVWLLGLWMASNCRKSWEGRQDVGDTKQEVQHAIDRRNSQGLACESTWPQTTGNARAHHAPR